LHLIFYQWKIWCIVCEIFYVRAGSFKS
jgi:hypothetical protein